MTITITGPARSGKTLAANQLAALFAGQGARVILNDVPVIPGVGAGNFSNVPSVFGSPAIGTPFSGQTVVIGEEEKGR